MSSQDEVNKITLLSYMRTGQELQSPFMSAESPVRRVGLSLVLLDIKTFPCLYKNAPRDWRHREGCKIINGRNACLGQLHLLVRCVGSNSFTLKISLVILLIVFQ